MTSVVGEGSGESRIAVQYCLLENTVGLHSSFDQSVHVLVNI